MLCMADMVGYSGDIRRYVTQAEKAQFPYNSVVKIIDNGSTGTGTFVSPDVILTCRHVVDTSEEKFIEYYTSDGQKHRGFVAPYLHDEASEHVVPEASSLAARLVGSRRLRVVGVGSKEEKQDAAEHFYVENRGGTLDEVHYEAHAQARHHSVDEVAHSSPAARSKAIPAALVEGTLNGQHPDRSHRCACHYSHHHTSHGKVEGVD